MGRKQGKIEIVHHFHDPTVPYTEAEKERLVEAYRVLLEACDEQRKARAVSDGVRQQGATTKPKAKAA